MFANMYRNIALILLLCGVNFGAWAQSDLPNVQFGTIKRIENFGTLIQPRNIDIWLPPGFSPSKKYPVLYLQDGQMLFDGTKTWNGQEWRVDEVLGEAIEKNEIDPFIVVGIWNNGSKRRAEYLPQKAVNVLLMNEKEYVLSATKDTVLPLFEVNLMADQYLKFVVFEVKIMIDSILPTLCDRSHTLIGGSSMGGLISLYANCEYPEIFGGALCMSTHWPGLFYENQSLNPFPTSMIAYLKTKIPDFGTHRYYFDCGDQTLDSMYPKLQKEVDLLFFEKGYLSDSKHYSSQFFPGENHSEAAWSKRLRPALNFLMTLK